MKLVQALLFTGSKKNAPKNISSVLNIIEALTVVAALTAIQLRWFYKFMIWPDSSNYLSAAINLVKTGTMTINTNWPSGTFLPTIEPYTAYPPGFPIFLSIFVLLFKDPLIGAAIGQSLLLVILPLLIYRVTVVLDFIPTIRIATLLFYMVFKSFTELQTGLLTEPLYISLTLGVFLCALSLWEGSGKKTWALAFLLVFLSGTVRWNGFANASLLLFPIWKHRQGWCYKLALATLAGILPNIIWFLRNLFLFGDATRIYKINGIIWEKVAVPFKYTLMRWGFGSMWILLSIIALALVPLFIKKVRNNLNFSFYGFVGLEVFIQFMGIYVLTLLVDVNPIDDRYLAPTYTFFVFLLFHSINSIIRTYGKLKFLVIIPWIFFLLSLPAVFFALKTRPISWVGSFTMPPERKLWSTLSNKEFYISASHFYTDDNFVHEIFVNKPHRIIFPSRLDWSLPQSELHEIISGFWNIGTKPIFVVSPNTPLYDYFENKGGLTPDVKKELVEGFWVYYKD